ncbi:MAG: nitroreductase family protein [Flavobacteriales bacterium]|nr:nitroreductase family protein [Flavobacteriales bacterium]
MSKANHPKEGFKFYEPKNFSEEYQKDRSAEFYHELNGRRSIREFSDKKIPDGVLENIIKAASTAPSGAHKQPWVFAVITSIEMKKKIREAAEKEEFENYHGRMSEAWLQDLEKFGTDWNKPFLEIAPALIVILKKTYDEDEQGKSKNYYVNESVGIATGMLISAINHAGLVTLTHTPSPMDFLAEILGRPKNEKPYLLLPVGFAAEKAQVPILERKDLKEVMVHY